MDPALTFSEPYTSKVTHMDHHGVPVLCGRHSPKPHQTHGKRLRGPCGHPEAGRRRPRHAPGRGQGRSSRTRDRRRPVTCRIGRRKHLPQGVSAATARSRPEGPAAGTLAPRGGAPPSSPQASATRLSPPPAAAKPAYPPPRGSRPASRRSRPKHCAQQQFPMAARRPRARCRPGRSRIRAGATRDSGQTRRYSRGRPAAAARGRGAGLRAPGRRAARMARCSPRPQSRRGAAPAAEGCQAPPPTSPGPRLGGRPRMPCLFRQLDDVISSCS